MSLHASMTMIKGDHLGRIGDVFKSFNYRLTGTVEHTDNWIETLKALQYPRSSKSRDIVYKAVFVHNGWTVILDPEMVMFVDEDTCTQISQLLSSSIFGMVCEGTSNSYGYSLYDGELVRAFWASDGEIFDNRGDILPEEEGIDHSDVFEDEVLKVMERFGVNYLDFENLQNFQIFELDESHMSIHSVSDTVEQPLKPSQENKKPWWKFW
jgi:hypothetical protein